MKSILMAIVKGYRLFLSPWLGSACRFEPTCSRYALEALEHLLLGGLVGGVPGGLALHELDLWGRIAAGVTELIAAVLLVVPQTVVFGALLTICSMLGAVAAHVFVIGVSVQNDGGLLLCLALLLLLAALALLILRRTEFAERLQQIRSTVLR